MHCESRAKATFVRPLAVFLVASLLLPVGATLIGNAFGTRAVRRTTSADLFVDDRYLDFGRAWSRPDQEWHLPIRNRSGRPIDLALRSGCTCTQIEPDALTIPPGELRSVRLALDLSAMDPADFRVQPRRVSVDIAPYVATVHGPTALPAWTVTGIVHDTIVGLVSPIHLGTISWDATAGYGIHTHVIHVANHVTEVTPIFDDQILAVELRPLAMDAPAFGFRAYELRIGIHEQVRSGELFTHLVLSPRDASGELLPRQRFQIAARLLGRVRLTQELIAFGAIPMGGSAIREVQVYSVANDPFSLAVDERVSIAGLDINVIAQSIGGPYVVRFCQKGVAEGAQQHDVLLRASMLSSVGTPQVLTLSIRYHGHGAGRPPAREE